MGRRCFAGVLSLLLMAALIAPAVAGVIYLIPRSEPPPRQKEGSGSTAESIAKERFARGELSREEFENLISQPRQ